MEISLFKTPAHQKLVLNERVVWLTLDNKTHFCKEQNEWNGTTMVLTSREADKTRLVIYTCGIGAGVQCFNACSKGWTPFLQTARAAIDHYGNRSPFTLNNNH